jgi:predicted DNA binding CopG/RHH family protein
MKKPIPSFRTDEEAEHFVDTADLSEYDLSGGQIMRFELKPKDKSVNLRLPEQLLEAVRSRAARAGIRISASSAWLSNALCKSANSRQSGQKSSFII